MSSEILCYPLAETRFIQLSGADTGDFLQAQLAINMLTLPGNGARLAPWLNAKGRVSALFSLAQLGLGDWLLATHESLFDALVPRLRLFVLRSAVTVSPMDDSWQALAIAAADGARLNIGFPLGNDVDTWTEHQGLLFRRTVPGAIEVWGPAAAVATLSAEFKPDIRALAHWQRQRLLAGLPAVTRQEQDRFTGHMLNLDLLGALSFDKGCYPGQEVVARTQNLGRPKRRALLFSCVSQLPEVGAWIVDPKGDRQGEVIVSVAGSPNLALAVVTLAASAQTLLLGASDGPELKRAEMPYPIPELDSSALGAHVGE